MKRFLTEAIAPKHELLTVLVPDCEREHSPQFTYAGRSVFFVQMNDHLGIRVGVKLVTKAFKLFPQLWEIVDFSVKDNPDRSVLIVDRLVSRR